MFILEGPYISDFIEKTIIDNSFQIIDTPFLKSRNSYQDFNLISEKEAISILEKRSDILYSNSENVIEWVEKNLHNTDYPTFIKLFKNKVKFRETIQPLFKHFYFKKIQYNDLQKIDLTTIPFPVVMKPSVGFFSLGVYTIENEVEWDETLIKLSEELSTINKLYPQTVVNTNEFIIESYISGKEYAVDCYFNENGDAVILNILEHQFSTSKDVSDRLYFTSKKIIERLHDKTLAFLNQLSELTGLKNFPLHLEMRVTSDNEIIPIEGNPMRFGGWCTTADLAYYAFGINAYELYQNQQKPNWESILNSMEDDYFGLVILDNSTGIKAENIADFNYNKLLSKFEKALELRKVDINQFPLFGYFYTQTKAENFQELSTILQDNLAAFVIKK
ncbi:MAG: ATP-grasp domain-containing protein [Flavobacteriaceae bacterium]|nr:ATP-grasp domain-containing protein [Flavobacteriaceae bacterium]